MKIFKIILAVAISAGMFISCDKIEEPYKEKVEKPTKNQNVLLEDYTAHKCTFCPDAHRIATDLVDSYGEENLIVVAIHGSIQAVTDLKHPYDFTTPDGNEYFSNYIPPALPTGIINKNKDNTGAHFVNRGDWGSVVDTLFQHDSPIEISIEASANNKQINGKIIIDFFSDVNQASGIQIWITEDSIISGQDDFSAPGRYVENYVHNHVFRGAINGTLGADMPQASYSEGSKETISFSNFDMGDDWVAKRLSIVAFVFDKETKRVIQVSKQHLHE